MCQLFLYITAVRVQTRVAKLPSVPTMAESSANPDNPGQSRARKPGKSSAVKRQPQRGMGVAKLERLRLEEWAKMNGIDPLQANLFQYLCLHVEPAPAPVCSPVQQGLDPPGSAPKFGGPGFEGFGDSGGFVGVDLYRNDGALQTSMEASGELPSMPKMDCVCDRCDVCFKKLMTGDNLGFSEEPQRQEKPSVAGFDFQGFDMGKDLNQYMRPSRLTMTPSMDAKVVAVHRKGNSLNGSVFMEYEFMPVKEDASMSEGVGGGGEASDAIPTTAAAPSSNRSGSNLIDLSLKLSY